MSSFTLRLHPGARSDLAADARWYDERSPAARRAFLAVIRSAFESIRANPWAYALFPGMPGHTGIRRFVVREFPYVIPYIVEQDAVIVIAVAHVRRMPGYWLARIER